MPLYEEKLISPLAVRFTQQRIRTTFRDGRDVEASINEISAGTGAGDYDIILTAPFPTIEIIRYSPNGRGAGGQGNDDHWFSFDNRRLYCLQRMAAEHWPKHVGVAVEVLYADNGAIRKKLDSLSCGLTVSIGHAFATADELDEWDWQQDIEVHERAPPGLSFATKAEAAVDADDAKSSVSELMDAPGALSAFDRLAKAFADSELPASAPVRCRTASDDSGRDTPSTAATEIASATVSEDLPSQAKKSAPLVLDAMRESLADVWTGEKGETYTVSRKGSQWHCVREDSYSSKKFTLVPDEDATYIWWGIQKSYYLSLSELAEAPDELRWYKPFDQPGRRPRFVWHKTPEVRTAVSKQAAAEAGRNASSKTPAKSQQTKWPSKPTQASQQSKWSSKPTQKVSTPPRSKQWVVAAPSGGA